MNDLALSLTAPPPGWPLSNAHVQTVCSSTLRKLNMRKRVKDLHAASERQVLTVADGINLELWKTRYGKNAPTVGLIHGWLGSAQSGYVLSAADHLWRTGFNVVRVNLRDHGETAGLNQEMFNSARIEEVVELVTHLDRRSEGFGLLGFSLGGNFALRVAARTGLPTLAICPAIDPAHTMASIDNGLPIYRHYFLRKWRRALQAKASAFPHLYDFSHAMRLNTVSDLTDVFVEHYSEFSSTDEYFRHYDLRGNTLEGVNAHIVATRDDPVIPPAQFENLPSSLSIHYLTNGGHCALLKNWQLETYCDDIAVGFFRDQLMRLVAQ
jgi:predicted alpha/beta-fold hydrolase